LSLREIPDKPYFKIGEVADIAGVRASVLRYWETEFRSIRPEKNRAGQRVYTRKCVERILRIRELLYEQGFTIAGARRKLREGGAAEPEVPGEADAADAATPAQSGGDEPLRPGRTRAAIEKAIAEAKELLLLCDE
jgi:DNA-binding transcriptional MerR regulator